MPVAMSNSYPPVFQRYLLNDAVSSPPVIEPREAVLCPRLFLSSRLPIEISINFWLDFVLLSVRRGTRLSGHEQSTVEWERMSEPQRPKVGVGVFVLDGENRFLMGCRKGSNGAGEDSDSDYVHSL